MKTALVDLHLHLDGSLYLPWAYETSLKRGVIPQDMTWKDYYERMYFSDFSDLEALFKIFDYPCDIMQTEEDLHDSIYYLLKMLADQGMVYAEVRYAPQLHTRGGLTQLQAAKAVISGLKDGEKDFGITARLIHCLMHEGGSARFNDAENRETVEVTRELLGNEVVALDLAGFENNCPFTDYKYLFDMAKEYGIPYTIHAGEMGIGEHVPEAIAMGAYRIGHGIDCVQNPEWLKQVVETQIPLEVCVTSNVRPDRSYAAHPVKQLIDAGANVTLNADNMMFSQTNVSQEHAMVYQLGVSLEKLKDITRNAMKRAFCDEETKKKCLGIIEERMK